MPQLPGGVQPPIGTLPPGNQEAIDVSLNQGAGGYAIAQQQPCVPYGAGSTVTGEQEYRGHDCAGVLPALGAAPLTQGRDLVADTEWNSWVDARYGNLSDHREGLDMGGRYSSVTVGVDRRVDNELIAGLSFGLNNSRNSGFSGDLVTESKGFTLSPYMAYQYSPNWVLGGSVAYGQTDNSQRIVILNGDYTSRLYSMSLNANGQYPLDNGVLVRPKAILFYGSNHAQSYDLQGTLLGRTLTLRSPKNSVQMGTLEPSVEFTRLYRSGGGAYVMPYVEAGVRYEFERPNDGRILTGNLSMAETSPWTGTMRLGVRALITPTTSIEAGYAYLSLGQSGLNIQEFKLYLSHAF
jgi:outer membrane autotransporter protein